MSTNVKEVDAPVKLYTISVLADRWDQDSLDAGENNPEDKEWLLKNEEMELDDLVRYCRDKGISGLSVDSKSALEGMAITGATVWFRSTYPDENRDYFEKGIHTYYHMYVELVDGANVTAIDIIAIAEALKIKLTA